MSNLEFFFFCTYLGIQILLPFKKYIYVYMIKRGKIYPMGDTYKVFTWSLVLTSAQGEIEGVLFDKETNEIICTFPLEIFLKQIQIQKIISELNSIIHFAKLIEKELHACGLNNYGIRFNNRISINKNAYSSPIDPKTDFTEENIHYFFPYSWIHFKIPKNYSKSHNKLS